MVVLLGLSSSWQTAVVVFPAGRSAYRKAIGLASASAPPFLRALTLTAASKPSHGLSMTYATAAPATAGGQGNSPVRFLQCVVVWGCDHVVAPAAELLLLILIDNR